MVEAAGPAIGSSKNASRAKSRRRRRCARAAPAARRRPPPAPSGLGRRGAGDHPQRLFGEQVEAGQEGLALAGEVLVEGLVGDPGRGARSPGCSAPRSPSRNRARAAAQTIRSRLSLARSAAVPVARAGASLGAGRRSRGCRRSRTVSPAGRSKQSIQSTIASDAAGQLVDRCRRAGGGRRSCGCRRRSPARSAPTPVWGVGDSSKAVADQPLRSAPRRARDGARRPRRGSATRPPPGMRPPALRRPRLHAGCRSGERASRAGHPGSSKASSMPPLDLDDDVVEGREEAVLLALEVFVEGALRDAARGVTSSRSVVSPNPWRATASTIAPSSRPRWWRATASASIFRGPLESRGKIGSVGAPAIGSSEGVRSTDRVNACRRPIGR